MTDVSIKDLTKKEIDNICNQQPDDGCNGCPLNMFGVCYKRIYKYITAKKVPVLRVSHLALTSKDEDKDEDEDV